MTDIKHLLEAAGDVPVPVDVEGDLARGRAAASRRGRVRLAAAATGVVLVAGAAVVGGQALAGDDRPGRGVDVAGTTGTPTPEVTPSPSSSVPSTPGQTITVPPVDPSTLVHTPFLDVPPPPPGWYVVGGQESYAMTARDGSDADLTGGFGGRLMVLLGNDQPGMPDPAWTAYDFDGRTFYGYDSDEAHLIAVQRDDGTWLRVQYPQSARFDEAEMVVYLAGVEVLPGAVAVS